MMHSGLFKRKNYSVQLNRCINIFHKLFQNFCAGNGCNDQGSLRSGVEACNDDKEMNSEVVEAVILKLMQHRNFSKKILAVGSIGSKCWRAAILESSPTYQMTREPRTTMRKVSLGIFHSQKSPGNVGCEPFCGLYQRIFTHFLSHLFQFLILC